MKNNKSYLFNSISILFLALSLIFQALTISKLSDRIEKLEEVKSIEVNKQEIIENNPPISIIPNEFYLGSIAVPWYRIDYTAGDDVSISYISLNYTIGASYDGLEDNILINYVNISYSFETYIHSIGGTHLFRSYRYNEITSFDFNYHIDRYDNTDYYLPLLMLQLDFSSDTPYTYLGLLNTQKQLIDDTKVLYSDSAFLNDLIYFINSSYASSLADLNDFYGQYNSLLHFDYIDYFFNLDQDNNYVCPYYLQFSNNTFNSLVATAFGSNGEGGGGGADEGYTQADLDQAYNSGFQAGEKSKNTFTLAWLGDIFDVVGRILSVEIFYGFKLWYFVGIIGIIGVIYGVMKLWR